MSSSLKPSLDLIPPLINNEDDRHNGEGDGIRKITNPSSGKRTATLSAKKFNARVPKDPVVRQSLEKTLKQMCDEKMNKTSTPKNRKLIKKSATVAEITPTSSSNKCKKRIPTNDHDKSLDIFVTPRVFDLKAIRKHCVHERFTCQIYRYLMLLAWRRTRSLAKSLEDAVKDDQAQINNFQMQINVLNQLRDFEGQKRDETLIDYQKLKNTTEALKMENDKLVEETSNLQLNLQIAHNEFKIAQTENGFLSDQVVKIQRDLNQIIAEKKLLEHQINVQQKQLAEETNLNSEMKEILEEAEKRNKILEMNYNSKKAKYKQLQSQFRNQLTVKKTIAEELGIVKNDNLNISIEMESVENELSLYKKHWEELFNSHKYMEEKLIELNRELEKERETTWLKNAKQLALLSLFALRRIAHIMLPAYI